MAWKKQEDKAVLAFEYVGMLPVNKIAVSDNMESRPIVVKCTLDRLGLPRKHVNRYRHWPSGLN